jgi:pseudouridine-5'-phosphate glycosidase
MDEPRQIAEAIGRAQALGVPGGMLVCNPLPEAEAIPAGDIEASIAEAVAEAERQGITRKAVTPFLLARVVALTKGRSLSANVALIRANAALGAAIAVELACLPA